jgi:mono/diheme cytochrome c family protein
MIKLPSGQQPFLVRSAATLTAAMAMFGAVGIARAQAPANTSTKASVTFTKDVVPILQRSCQNCHRPNNMAPMSFLTYQDIRPWARSIKEKVVKRDMPPWFIDRSVGIREFKDDPSLTDQEIATIAAWVDGGAPEGNRADMPPPRQFEDTDRWHIGKPDLIVSMPVSYTVKPENSDQWLNFTTDSGLTEDRYIKAVETKPSPAGIRVVHHGGTSMIAPDGGQGQLNEYAVGKNGDIYPEGSGKLIKAGAQLRFGMHYHSIGQQITDQTSVAFIFYPKGEVPKHVINAVMAETKDIDIPPGADNVRSDAYYKMEKPARLTAYQPHMHNRGKAQCIEAIYPNMTVEQLNCVSRFNFGWQIAYNYADDVAPLLPAGTIIHVTSWHDNSPNNRWNPDPRSWVGYGERSTEDMSRAWLNFYYMTDEEFKAEVAARNTQRPKLTSQR